MIDGNIASITTSMELRDELVEVVEYEDDLVLLLFIGIWSGKGGLTTTSWMLVSKSFDEWLR